MATFMQRKRLRGKVNQFRALLKQTVRNVLSMGIKMATVAILCLLLLEHFLAADIDVFTEPVLRGLRDLEKSALTYTRSVIPPDILTRHRKLTRFYLFTPELSADGVQLDIHDKFTFLYFRPERETKIIIHGFMDKVSIAQWMHDMKDEFLLLDSFNVIIVDWSNGNFIPYSQAAANTERVGDEISSLMKVLMENYGAKPSKFHLIGHSLGSHVAGYVGERIKGLKRITGLDPATHMFTNASPRSKLDRSDAEFVDVIHTDAGGIGIVEPAGHVDFYPNGGEIQPGCTASNSLRSLIEKGVVEGVRNIICSHMRAPLLFTDTINGRHCDMLAHECSDKDAYAKGECDTCLESGAKCASMGYHVDTGRDYGNGTKFYLLTSSDVPYCGYEYKLTLSRLNERDKTWRDMFKRSEWSSLDLLHVSLYGTSGSAEFTLEGRSKQAFQSTHMVLSYSDLGMIHGAVAYWSRMPLTKARGMANVITKAVVGDHSRPFINKIEVKPMKTNSSGRNIPVAFELCVNPSLASGNVQKGATFRKEYC